MWQKLQIEVDKLLEAGYQGEVLPTSDEGAAIGTLYGSDHYTNSSDRDLPHDFADESHKPVEATLTTAFWPDELLLEEPFVL